MSYQANKDQLVKRLILKYSQIYEQYTKGLIPYDEAKRYGDWINDNNIVYVPPQPQPTPPKLASPPSTSITRTNANKPIIINVPHSSQSYGRDLNSYPSGGSNQYSSSGNNNNYYNYNAYVSQSNNSGNNPQYYSNNNNGIHKSTTSSGYGSSGSSKSSAVDVSPKPPPELVFPKRYSSRLYQFISSVTAFPFSRPISSFPASLSSSSPPFSSSPPLYANHEFDLSLLSL